jgi:hypothetical protein
MLFQGETREQYWAKNKALVEKWEREDAPAVARILPQWEMERDWHPWFAWLPVDVGDGKTAWLHTVERRLRFPDNKPTIMASWQVRSHVYRLRPTEGLSRE